MIDPNIQVRNATSSVAKPKKRKDGLTLAIDFDGVIHDTDNRVHHTRMGLPHEGSIEALHSLFDAGHTIIIHSCKATSPDGLKSLIDWLNFYEAPYHAVTAIKPNADYYIDNKAINHTNWPSTLVKIGFSNAS